MTETFDNLRVKEVSLTVPLSDRDIRGLELGDIVYLNGLIFTGRIGVYRKLFEERLAPPIDIAHRCNVTFHCSPAVREDENGEYTVSSVTGTASFRFAKYVPRLIDEYGVKAVIGKGGMSNSVNITAFKDRAIYLTTVGYGMGAKYGRGIKRVTDVFWRRELGLAQAMWVFEVEQMGPFIVECDVNGNSLQSLAKKETDESLITLLQQFPSPALKRHGEVDASSCEVVD
jgi:L(+)-tartrate dehydratase beta subunit